MKVTEEDVKRAAAELAEDIAWEDREVRLEKLEELIRYLLIKTVPEDRAEAITEEIMNTVREVVQKKKPH